MKNRKLIRTQLETTLQRFRPLLHASMPAKGWIRAIRDALGMSARQLALRLGVTQQWVATIEKEERTGAVTIKTMNRVAECLDCVFVCGFVPRKSLEESIRAQAKQVVERRLTRASHTMGLEAQALGAKENGKILSNMVDTLVENPPSTLWNDK